MTYAGAKGETAAQMSEVLGFSHLTFNVHAVFLATLGSKDFTLALANGIFLDEGFSICPSFSELLAKYYIASARRLPFHDEPRISADAINDWVTYQTSYTIQEIVTTNDVADADFALMNAVYFGGLWKFPFDERRTRLATFDVSPLESVTVNMMVQTARLRFSYNRRLHSRILELPYEGDRLAMYIILPVQKNGLAALERKLSFGTVTSAIADLSRRRVPIAIPRFKMSVDENLPDILSDMGMNLAFTPAADFSGIASGVFITKVIHAAFIGMNEKGTEAAADTAVDMGTRTCTSLTRATSSPITRSSSSFATAGPGRFSSSGVSSGHNSTTLNKRVRFESRTPQRYQCKRVSVNICR